MSQARNRGGSREFAGVGPIQSSSRRQTSMYGRLIRPRYLAVATVALALLGGGAYALAASSSPFIGPHGNINTCVPTNGGEVNVWKPGHRCGSGRVGLAFPTVGAPGATGATGASGTTGATGATG